MGCEDTGEIATDDNHIIRFCSGTAYAHPTIMDLLGSAMWEAQYRADYGIKTGPTKYCVLLPDMAKGPRKESNASTGHETIEWFIRNLHPPKGGAIFSLYQYKQQHVYYTGKWNTQVIWPLNKDRQWVGDGDYITLQDIEPSIFEKKKGKHHLEHPTYDVIKQIDDLCPYEVKRIDYSMSEDEIFDALKHSKLHLSYHGGTLFTAGMIDIPTVCFGWSSGKYTAMWDDYGKKESVTINITSWNNGTCNPPTKVHHYDWENDRATQRPQNYLMNCDNPRQLTAYVTGFEPITWFNRTYQL